MRRPRALPADDDTETAGDRLPAMAPAWREAALRQLVARVGAGLLLVVGISEARAQDDTSTSPATQIWANLTLGRTVSERTYLELDIEPKWQVTSGEEWRNIDFTPLVEYYPTSWLDLEAEGGVGRTRQRDGLNTFEMTPRIGARLHLFKQVAGGHVLKRLPLKRVTLSTLVRLEWRNLFYSDDTPNQHEWRARLRLEGKLAISGKTLSQDRMLYAIGDAEYFAPLSDDVPEQYVNKVRTRIGLGYVFSPARRLEFLYIRDWNQSSPDAAVTKDTQAFDLRLKMLF
jgi:hypothetical protein